MKNAVLLISENVLKCYCMTPQEVADLFAAYDGKVEDKQIPALLLAEARKRNPSAPDLSGSIEVLRGHSD